LYERNVSGTWVGVQKLIPSDREEEARFGHSLSFDGSYLGVTAHANNYNASGADYQLAAGAAYVFQRDANGSWNESQKIVSSDRETGDYFGYSIGISGYDMIVGAVQEDEDIFGANTLSGAGSAYFFTRPILKSIAEEETLTAVAFPNPTSGNFNLEFDALIGDAEVRVINLVGEVLQVQKISNTSRTALTINEPDGYYMIDVRTADGRVAHLKVLKR